MKKILIVCLVALMPGIMNVSFAQQKKDTTVGQKIKTGAKKTGKAIDRGATAVGNKTAEVASKGASKMVDKTYEGKVGPLDQTIYINNKAKYYWVDKKGKRHFVTEMQLKNKG